MNFKKIIILAIVFLYCTAFIAFHHGWADYDQNKTIEYTGTIQATVFENPHVTTKVKNKNKTWTVILAPISRITDRGVTVDMLKKGNSIKVVGYPHKKIKTEMRAERIFINDNKYELR